MALFSLLGAGVFVWTSSLNHQKNANHEFIMHRAESLAYQILESQRVSSRGPASAMESNLNQHLKEEGRIGSDPWGRPFNFKLLKNPELQSSKVLVWSVGPDGVAQTTPEKIDSIRDKSAPTFEGDDVGVMVSIK